MMNDVIDDIKDIEIDFYNYHAIDILEIVLKDTGIETFMPDKIALLEKKLQDFFVPAIRAAVIAV